MLQNSVNRPHHKAPSLRSVTQTGSASLRSRVHTHRRRPSGVEISEQFTGKNVQQGSTGKGASEGLSGHSNFGQLLSANEGAVPILAPDRASEARSKGEFSAVFR